MKKLSENLYWFKDSCNVFLIKHGNRAMAIDFGSGAWLDRLKRLNIEKLEHVFLTHHHADQCHGLITKKPAGTIIHAAYGEREFLAPGHVRQYWRTARDGGCPRSYSVISKGIKRISYDIGDGSDFYWKSVVIRFIHTPGHGSHALSIIMDIDGMTVVFCGDSAYADAKIWEPHHLEWHHKQGTGVLAAWQGVKRLSQVHMDMLCPSHGPVIDRRPNHELRRLAQKLLDLHDTKLSVCPGERDYLWPSKKINSGSRKILPHLYHFGGNGYLLLSGNNEALIVDPTLSDMPVMKQLHAYLKKPGITAAIATHYHSDHCDAIPLLQKEYKTRACLHPWVAEPLRRKAGRDVPFLSRKDIKADELLPERGKWTWNEYCFKTAPFPAQTWWHAAHQTEVDGVKVFFGGDNFQPTSRWDGTGGYCSYNGCHFRKGWYKSAQLVVDWSPDILCNGHNTCYKFKKSRFQKIQKWALRTEGVLKQIVPSGSLEKDYYRKDLFDLAKGRKQWGIK